jgi:cell division protein FtsN
MSNELDTGTTLPEREDHAQMRHKLLWRMGVAGLMIVVLLGGLALFDHLAVESDEPEPVSPYFTEPVPVPEKSVTQALGPVVPAPPEEEEGEAVAEASQVVPEASAVPEGPIVAEAALPGAPLEAAAKPAAGPVARSPSRSVPLAPSSSSLPPAKRPGARKSPPEAVPSSPPSPSRPKASETRVPPVFDSGAARVSAIPRSPPVLTKLLSGHTLQAGVFSDPRRAEDVYARLVQEGIPVTLETRVLVGPFKNRKEAESARAKMKAMGIEALPIPRGGK